MEFTCSSCCLAPTHWERERDRQKVLYQFSFTEITLSSRLEDDSFEPFCVYSPPGRATSPERPVSQTLSPAGWTAHRSTSSVSLLMLWAPGETRRWMFRTTCGLQQHLDSCYVITLLVLAKTSPTLCTSKQPKLTLTYGVRTQLRHCEILQLSLPVSV